MGGLLRPKRVLRSSWRESHDWHLLVGSAKPGLLDDGLLLQLIDTHDTWSSAICTCFFGTFLQHIHIAVSLGAAMGLLTGFAGYKALCGEWLTSVDGDS